MIAVYISPLYCAFCVWMAYLFLRWLRTFNAAFRTKIFTVCFCIVYGFLSLCTLFAFWCPKGTLKRVLQLISNYWLGFCLYAVMILGVACIIWLVLFIVYRKAHDKMRRRERMRMVGTVCVVLIALICVGGAINARIIRTTEYNVTVEKDGGNIDNLHIVMLGDLHMGYNFGHRQLQKTVDKINAQNPDIVMIAGDFFDNQYEALDDPDLLAEIFRGIESKYGVFGVYGNHDVEEKILGGFTFENENGEKYTLPSDEMRSFCSQAGIYMLEDETVLIDDSFYLCGRPDSENEDRDTPEELLEPLDHSKPIIVLDHEPGELDAMADAGADLDLNGHTHNGQLFPGTITIKFFWENAYGYLKKGNMHDIVTSGVGVFGPYMRTGCRAEICSINVAFTK